MISYYDTDPPSASMETEKGTDLLFIAESGSGARYAGGGVQLLGAPGHGHRHVANARGGSHLPPYFVMGAPVALIVLAALASPLHAEMVGCTSTTFRLFSPNDKVCVQAFDDPRIPGVTCHISQAKTGGYKGALGVAEDPSRFAITCHQTGPITLPAKLPDEESVFTRARRCCSRTQGDPHVRHEAQHDHLRCHQQTRDRRLADERHLGGAGDAVGNALTVAETLERAPLADAVDQRRPPRTRRHHGIRPHRSHQSLRCRRRESR